MSTKASLIGIPWIVDYPYVRATLVFIRFQCSGVNVFVCLTFSQTYLYVVLFLLTVHVSSGQAVFNSR